MKTSLRISKRGTKAKWTKDEVLLGLNRFFKLYNRYPTAGEIDAFEHLPTSRTIQRQFGGLVALRKELIPTSYANYTKGVYRSSIARDRYRMAERYEEEFYNFLCKHFDPIAIHEHKIMRPGNITSDYFIYFGPNKGVVLDLFYAQDLHSVSGVLSVKLRRYNGLPYPTIFVLVGNNEIDIDRLRRLVSNKKNALPPNILVDTEINFKSSTIYDIKERSQYFKSD
jgi:hypothetical protein